MEGTWAWYVELTPELGMTMLGVDVGDGGREDLGGNCLGGRPFMLEKQHP